MDVTTGTYRNWSNEWQGQNLKKKKIKQDTGLCGAGPDKVESGEAEEAIITL